MVITYAHGGRVGLVSVTGNAGGDSGQGEHGLARRGLVLPLLHLTCERVWQMH